jgi:hypothetical protein
MSLRCPCIEYVFDRIAAVESAAWRSVLPRLGNAGGFGRPAGGESTMMSGVTAPGAYWK